MTSTDVDVVRRMFEAFARGGFAAIVEFFDPDFEGRQLPNHPDAATFLGPRDAVRSMTNFMESFEDFRAEAEEFIDAGGGGVVVALRERGRPRGGSVELDQRFGIVYMLRDGKIIRMEMFDSFEEACAKARADD